MKFAPVTVAPETWPPLAQVLKYQKKRGKPEGAALTAPSVGLGS